MATINRLWYLVAAIFIIGVTVIIIHFANSKSYSAISDSKSINKTAIQIDIKPLMVDVTTDPKIRIWPKSLPKPPHCGNAAGGDRIIGGHVLQFDEQPWTALLDYQYDNGIVTYDCGGTLINHEYVITAAHCLTDSHRKLVGVLLGEQDLFNEYDCLTTDPEECATDKPQLYPIAKIIIHPRYSNETKQNDIALVKLNATVKYNEITSPICLPGEDFYTQRLSKVAFAIGWGLTNSSDKSSESNVKQMVDLPVWDRITCAQKFRTIDTQICAGGEEGKDSCTYDSGGPLVRLGLIIPPSWFLEGIVSYGFNGACGMKGYPGVYTNVSAHMDWILETVAG